MKTILLCSAALTVALGHAASAQSYTLDDLKVESYQLVSSKRVSRTEFEYEYRPTIRNNTLNAYAELDVYFAPRSSGQTPVDVYFRTSINATSSKAASETIKIRVNRTQPFNPLTELAPTFGVPTLQGLDLNANGIRDQVEVAIDAASAEMLGQPMTAKQREIALEAARSANSVIIEDQAASAQEWNSSDKRISHCLRTIMPEEINFSSYIYAITFDTAERYARLREAQKALPVTLISNDTMSSEDAFCREKFGD